MKIAELITLAENKLAALNNEMSYAIQVGEVEEITRIEAQVSETQATLDQLRSVA